MHEEQGGEEVQGPGPDIREGMREASVQQPCQGKVEVAGEGEPHLPVHLAQWPFHAVSRVLHHLTQVLPGSAAAKGLIRCSCKWVNKDSIGKQAASGLRRSSGKEVKKCSEIGVNKKCSVKGVNKLMNGGGVEGIIRSIG